MNRGRIGTNFASHSIMRKEPAHVLKICWGIILSMTATGCVSGRERSALADYYKIKGRFVELNESGEETKNPRLPDLSENASLAACLEYGAAQSPSLRAAFENWKASLEKIPQARALPDPELRYSYFIQAVETRAGPQRNRFGVSQKIPWPEKLALNSDIAFLHSQSLRHQFEESRRKVFYQIKLAYFGLYFVDQSILITKETTALARYYERIALTRYRASGGKHPDVIRAQLELGRLEDQLKTLSDLKSLKVATLNSILNRSPNNPLALPGKLPIPRKWPEDTALDKLMMKNNSQLAALHSELAREEKSIDRASKDYYPDFMLGVDYIDTGSSIQNGSPDSGKDPVILNFGITLPLWRSKYAAGEREAEARRQSLAARKQATLRRLEATLQQALFNLRDSQRKIDLYKKSLIPKAEQAQRGIVSAFEAGKSDFLSLIDIQRSFLEFNLNYQRALTDQARADALIERLVGDQSEKKQ